MKPFRLSLLTLATAIVLVSCQTQTLEAPIIERFAPCPSSPNCVSSYATDALHAIDPLPLVDSSYELANIVRGIDRTEIIEIDGDYLHATFTSRVFRFVDDVEFLIDRDAGVTQVRSASRVGYGDIGANRSRVEDLRRRITGDSE